LPHLTKEDHPAESLAAFIFETSGVRLTKGPPPAPSQVERGIELLRVAIPARRYLRAHLDHAADAVIYAYDHRESLKALRRIEKPGRGRFAPPLFARVEE
jgi:tyrosine phenol-lyase